MAVISLTGVELVSNTEPELYVANEAIAAGDLFYLDSDDKANVADAVSPANDDIAGVALTAAAEGNIVVGIPDGATIRITNTVANTDVYILADTAGDMMLNTDLTTGQFSSRFAEVITITPQFHLKLDFNHSGIAKA